MKTKLFILLGFLIVFISLRGTSSTPVAAQEPEPPGFSLPLPDDLMPPVGRTEPGQPELFAAADYKVMPILFVANDLTPNPFALQSIDRQMELTQRWYGEQLYRKTFSLEPARLVVGSQPLAYYYGNCYPPTSSCSWGYEIWSRVFDDLANLGYPWQANRIVGVFFQEEGVGGVALGAVGGNQFLVGLNSIMVFGDCLQRSCAASVTLGGVAHELGHALGLPHTADDPEGSPGKSVMSWGFYSFPKVTLVNTPTNPERDQLYASPFINLGLKLKNGGFENSLSSWKKSAGTFYRTNLDQLSGLYALAIPSNSGRKAELSQTRVVGAGEVYDFSAWLSIFAQSSDAQIQIKVQALSSAGSVLATFTVGDYTQGTNGWVRSAASMTMPARTTQARIRITTQGLINSVYLDDIYFRLAQLAPPISPPMFHSNGQAVPDLQPWLRWANNASATSFRLQIATDSQFSGLVLNRAVTSPFYRVPKDLLTYGTRYFWRVRASNGAGQSSWSPTWSFVPRSANRYYDDEFETGPLGSAWFWVREDPGHWGLGGPLGLRDYGYMGITIQAGDLHKTMNNAKNILLRNAPSGDFGVSTTCDFWGVPSTEYQQGGLIIYRNDDNYLKLVRIYDGHYKLQWLAEVNGTVVRQFSIPSAGWMPFKIAHIGNSYGGYYSPDGVSWRRVGQTINLNWSNPKMGLLAFSRIEAPEITAYFDYFRVGSPNVPAVSSLGEEYQTFLPLILK